MLKRALTGRIGLASAASTIAEVRGLYDRLWRAAGRLGYFIYGRRDLAHVLSAFAEQALPRARQAGLLPQEIRFARSANSYLELIDRNFEETGLSKRFRELIAYIDNAARPFRRRSRFHRRVSLVGGRLAMELYDCAELRESLDEIMPGYLDRESAPPARNAAVALRIWRNADRYWWDMPFPGDSADERKPLTTLRSLLSSLHKCVDDLHAQAHRDQLYLHSGGIEIGGKVVLLLGRHHVGKSVLAFAFAGHGYRIFNDDQIGIDARSGLAVAIGRVPMLRLPVPANTGSRLIEELASDEKANSEGSARLVRLPSRLFAPMGETLPIGGMIHVLRSDSHTVPKIEPAGETEMLKQLLARHRAKTVPPARVFDLLHGMVRGARLFRLQYRDADAAAQLVADSFAASPAGGTRS